MVTDQKHSSDVSSEQEVIRRTEKIAKLLELDKQNVGAYKALSGQIWELEKKLDDYHSEYNSLKKMVKRLERDVEDLNECVELLDECVDRETVVDLIQEIVPSIIGKKGPKGCKGSSYSSESSKDSDSVEIIEVRERKAVPHKQRRKA